MCDDCLLYWHRALSSALYQARQNANEYSTEREAFSVQRAERAAYALADVARRGCPIKFPHSN